MSSSPTQQEDGDETTLLTRNERRMACITEHLRITVLYEDEAVVVIDKPCNLRSVPGHASPPPEPTAQDSNEIEHKLHRSTAQESWALAIRSFQNEEIEEPVGLFLRNLAAMRNVASVPRKWGPFRRHCQRNQKRLTMDSSNQIRDKETKTKRIIDVTELDSVVRKMHERIKRRQLPLMNLPKATEHEDSAYGQLILLGYADTMEEESDASRRRLFVVHRLDCQTSGVMVFARDEQAASKLSQAWRERDQVSKIYLARVKDWPPFHKEKQLEGRIDAPLAPSQERLKWKVETNGKPSTTLWKICGPLTDKNDSVVLQLTPMTGRTHQLRVHCAHVGSGIEGDSLYGDNRVEWNPHQVSAPVLCLHAHNLSFPHPRTGERMEFMSTPSWYEMIGTNV